VAAALLLGFILLVERRGTTPGEGARHEARLVSLKPESVTAIQLRRTNQFVLRAERTNQGWNITSPIVYPAQAYAIERLLEELGSLSSFTYLSPEELRAGGKTVADFGLDLPAAALTLHHDGKRSELLFGAPTAAGEMVYFQVLDRPGIYVVPGAVSKRLPRTANEWRDPLLFSLEGLNWDRFEVRGQGRSYAVQFTNGQFYLSKPTPARADRARIDALLRKLINEPVVAFVADNLRGELEEWGFQPPEAEMAFGLGTNDSAVVQFGRNASNDLIYARRLMNNNVVLVSRSVLEAVQTPALELRDRHLLSFNPAAVESFQVIAEESFQVRREGSNSWTLNEPSGGTADSELVRGCLNLLMAMEGDVEKDVVTAFGSYGLAQPVRRYLLNVSGSGSEGQTNRQSTWLDVGGRRNAKVYARGPESTVYAVDASYIDRLPVAAWQLRDRRVWSFSTNQVLRLAVRHNGQIRQLVRGAGGQWNFESGSGIITDPFLVEETMYRLGELRAAMWVDRGEGKRQLYGFREDGDKLVIEIKNGDKTQQLSLEFGERPYALAVIDGQSWIFEFPLALHIQGIQRLFKQVVQPFSANAAP
jgi:hypothetical protein